MYQPPGAGGPPGGGYGGPPPGGGYGGPPPGGGAPPGYGGPPPGYGGPPGYPPPGGMPYGGGGGYEFGQAENATIGAAALWARILGIVLIVIGTIGLLNCSLIDFALKLAVGIFFILGGNALATVVNTQGNDVAHMMTAMQKLGTAFKIRVIATIVGVVLILGLFILAMLIFVVAAAGSGHP